MREHARYIVLNFYVCEAVTVTHTDLQAAREVEEAAREVEEARVRALADAVEAPLAQAAFAGPDPLLNKDGTHRAGCECVFCGLSF